MSMPYEIRGASIRISGDGASACDVGAGEFATLWFAHRREDPFTAHLEDFAAQYVVAGLPVGRTQLLVRMVCAWGGLRGKNPKRVYQQNSGDGFLAMNTALQDARRYSLRGNYLQAIETFADFEGLGISFKSKILKFLCPNHAAVLDSKIRERLAYAHSPQGYRSLVEDCVGVRNHLNSGGLGRYDGQAWRTSDVEMAIFMKIR